MAASHDETLDLIVIGAGPAGVVAALRAARLGARTALVSRDAFGGMAANDGPIPVRTLAHAARLMREARQLGDYGITGTDPVLDYPRLLARVREVTRDVRADSLLREDLETAGVVIYEHAGTVRFVDAHTIESDGAPPLRSSKFIVCTGTTSGELPVPGFDVTCTHSDAWQLDSVPASMLVIGAGATGVQVASIFAAFGSRVHLFEAAPRILMSEDEDVSEAVRLALGTAGIEVIEGAGRIERFERTPDGVRTSYARDGVTETIDATLVVTAVGRVGHTAGLDLAAAGVEVDRRGCVVVDAQLRTTAVHIYAAGDVTGTAMLVPEATREGYLAANNAVLGAATELQAQVSPVGSFTDPEYASVGLTDAQAREREDVIVASVAFDTLPRPIIDGRPYGFCKLIVDRERHRILGCHIVGERAVELAQVAATAMAAGMRVEELADVQFSFPTYANALRRAAFLVRRELGGGDEPDGAS